jgi:radical SAM superfamily enzyme YgiQ (UPF0313 family)
LFAHALRAARLQSDLSARLTPQRDRATEDAMELAVRKGADRFVPAGTYRALEARIRRRGADLAEIPAVVLSAFDRRTRMLPFLVYDQLIFPAGARAVAGSLYEAGFARTRALFELWNPRFRASRATFDGRPLQMLLVSAMQIHAGRAYAAVHDAVSMGEDRPLVIVGGPKAVFEPYHYWSAGAAAPDVAVTGEVFVLLELLEIVLAHKRRGEALRAAFERARMAGALDGIAGLVFLAPGADRREPALVDTGLARLVEDLDELPSEATGLALLEPPHRGAGLSPAPIPPPRLRRFGPFVSVLMTQGCKFNCGYCPIPALQQKSWRFRSPERLVEIMRDVGERFSIKYFFGVDDNFFNRRDTAEQLLTAMASATVWGRPFGQRIQFATEATQFDTYRQRDLLPLARAAGMHSIWFGIEDLTASLINKGQKPAMTIELFRIMHELKISPMTMLMFHQHQPFYSRGSLHGLYNQVEFLRRAGAVSMQCTVHTPAVGTREYEATYESGRVIERVGGLEISDREMDANHVVVRQQGAAWKRQVQLLGGYAAFYNPWNVVRALRRDGSRLRKRRFGYQLVGFLATLWTVWRIAPYVLRLARGKVGYRSAPPAMQTITVRQPASAFARYPLVAAREQLTAVGERA